MNAWLGAAVAGIDDVSVRLDGIGRVATAVPVAIASEAACDTGLGALVGVPGLGWSVDQGQTGLGELLNGQPQQTLGGQLISSMAGNGPVGTTLNVAYDVGPPLVLGGIGAYREFASEWSVAGSDFSAPFTADAYGGTINAAPGATANGPTRIYSAHVLIRSAEESGPFHNFPESFNQQIFDQGTRTVTPNFFNTAKAGLSNDSVMYRLPGSVNGVEGTFEIGVRPSVSGNTEVIMHRFFRPNP